MLGGGSGYGGKSYVLRTCAVEANGYLRSLGFPGCTGAIFVKTYTTLADRQIEKLERELGHLGEVKYDKKRLLHFRFFDPTMGRILLRNLDDPSRSKGAEIDWGMVDEVTENTRKDFGDILYMIRNSRRLPFKSFGGATNPDGIGHVWVKKLWIERDFSDEPKAFQRTQNDYVFVRFKPQDNPTFDDDVAATLQSHPDPMIVKARWEGSWDLLAGVRFSQFRLGLHDYDDEEFWDLYSAVSPFAPDIPSLLRDPNLFSVYGSFDYGTDMESAASFHLHAVDFMGRVWTFAELYLRGLFLNDQAEAIKEFIKRWGFEPDAIAEERGIDRIYCDPALHHRDSDGISRLDKFRNHGLRMVQGINNRVEGWATFDSFLHYRKHFDHDTLSETFLSVPAWRIHKSCSQLIGQMRSAPRDVNNPEDLAKSFKTDHALDDTRYFLHSHFPGGPTVKEEIAPGSLAWLRKLSERRDDVGGDPSGI